MDIVTENPKTSSVVFVILIIYIYLRSLQKDRLVLYYDSKSTKLQKALDNSKLTQLVFNPSILLLNGHIQTLMAGFNGDKMLKTFSFCIVRELFKLNDGGTIAIDWVDNIPKKDGKEPILVIIPGISGNNNEQYILNTIKEGKRHGYQSVIINYRSGSGIKLTSPKAYCAASSDDFRQPLKYISETYCQVNSGSKRQIFMMGVSLGANILGNLIGEDGENSLLTAACCVNPPMKLWVSNISIKTSLFGVYSKHLTASLKKRFATFTEYLKEPLQKQYGIDFEKELQSVVTLEEFDAKLTAVINGYGNLENYYDKASCYHKIPNIKIPTFFLFAEDDPIIGNTTIDPEICHKSEYVLLGTTKRGGHVGYHEKVFSTDQWFPIPVFEFLNSYKSSI